MTLIPQEIVSLRAHTQIVRETRVTSGATLRANEYAHSNRQNTPESSKALGRETASNMEAIEAKLPNRLNDRNNAALPY